MIWCTSVCYHHIVGVEPFPYVRLRQSTALAKKIDKIAEAGSLVPGDVHNCVRRIVAVQEALDR